MRRHSPRRQKQPECLHRSIRHYLLFLEDFFPEDDFFLGTFAPSFRASERPIAIACFLLVTFFPDRPLFSVPSFISCIALSPFVPAFFPYLAIGPSAPYVVQI